MWLLIQKKIEATAVKLDDSKVQEGEEKPGDVVTAKYVREPAELEQLLVPELQEPDRDRARIPEEQDTKKKISSAKNFDS